MFWRNFFLLTQCQNRCPRYWFHLSTRHAIQKLDNHKVHQLFPDRPSACNTILNVFNLNINASLKSIWRNQLLARCSTSTTTSQQNKLLVDADHLSHVDKSGKANMVDIKEKPITHRTARATGLITLGETAFHLLRENQMKKGDVLTVADVAGVMAAKETSRLIPLCHTIPLSNVNLTFLLDETKYSVRVITEASTQAQTGVEMEALMAASVSLLTIYDMCKAVSKEMVISDIRLIMKIGGKENFYGNEDLDSSYL